MIRDEQDSRLIPVRTQEEIPPQWQDTPVGRLLEYHNCGRPFDHYDRAALLIGMCMDHRNQLRVPDQFAYVLRAGGANLRPSDFKVSYAVAVGGVRSIALIGHTECGMSNLAARREEFVAGLVDAGWNRDEAMRHFTESIPRFEIGDEVDFVINDSRRLRARYPAVSVAPLIYLVEDRRLYLVREPG
ncbi:MAG TPA: carbonic anhydrase [Gemmatimonadota bacterium]|nr:carbonic anhydrase [Gemmatimonadota bacterium]